jgi:hypothetical protein
MTVRVLAADDRAMVPAGFRLLLAEERATSRWSQRRSRASRPSPRSSASRRI